MSKRPIIALLGGGQLGRMFIENALRYDVRVHVLDPDPQAPCAGIAHHFVTGDLQDERTVLEFAADADIIGIEIEHVNTAAMEELQRSGKRVIPDPRVLSTIQDKGLQKQFYRDNGIPTSEFELIDGPEAIEARKHLLPAFLKSRTGGYDGKGVMAIADVASASSAFPGPAVLEQRADIALELAVLVAVTDDGAHIVYDPVEMVFNPELNLVDHLRSPARIPAAVSQEASALGVRVAQAFQAPGLYAVELFLTKDGTLLVNETAPRAHNSGHHTIEACPSSQFDQLLRIYMGWPLGGTLLRGTAAMVNLIGEGGTGEVSLQGLTDVLHVPDTFVHLYGKRETRSGRKMGHVTVLGKDATELDQAISIIKLHCKVVPQEDRQEV